MLALAGCAGPQLALPRVEPAAPTQRAWRMAGAGELVLRCTPFDAEVALDGVTQGSCQDFNGEPNALKVGTTARRVEVKKSGFHTWESWLAADQTRVVMTVTLLPNGGSP